MEQVYQPEDQRIQLSGSPSPGSADSSPAVLRADRSHRSSLCGIEGCLAELGDLSHAPFTQTGRGAEGDEQGLPSPPDSDEIQSVQKRSHPVQFMHDVDGKGVRTWRRSVVEYS